MKLQTGLRMMSLLTGQWDISLLDKSCEEYYLRPWLWFRDSLQKDELFMPKYFAWTGNAALGDYCVSTTSSHYDWAMKKIKAHIKNCAKKES